MKLLELQGTNVFPFKQVTLDLDYEGITVIRGLNKDDGPKATNAAGKSRLVAMLADLALDETPTGKEDNNKIKGKKKARKQQIRVRLQKGKHEYQITKTIGKGKSYEIVKDGKSTDVRTVKYSTQKIREIFGFSTDDQFYTRFYLDGTIPHPLIVGSAAARQEFVVDLFDLKNIDSVRKLLNAELTAIGKKAVEYKTIKRTLDELREDLLPKADRLKIRERLAELNSRQEKLSHALQSSQQVSQLLTFERQNKQLLERFDKLKLLVEPRIALREYKNEIAGMHAARDLHHEWTAYDKAYDAWRKSYAPVKEALEKLGCDVDTVRAKYLQSAEYEAELKAQLRLAKDPGKEPEKVDPPKYAMEDCNVKVHQYREEMKHAQSFKEGRCTLCGSKVKSRSKDEVQADLSKWVKRINACEDFDRRFRQHMAWSERNTAYEKAQERVKELHAKIDKRRKYVVVHEMLGSVREKPSKPVLERPGNFNEERLEKLGRKRELLDAVCQVWDTILDLRALTKKDREQAKEAESHVGKLNEVMAEISELTTKDVKQREIIRRLKGLKEQADALHEECKDEKLLKALVGAYSTSGLKKFMIERYSKLLEQQINKYRKMFFAENYEFELRYDAGLKVIVHRFYGKRTESSDVRKLSGAEKRFFTLLLYVAANTMLPAKKRVNVLILDEPESQMGEPAIERFVKTLSILRRLVPHIVIVTPKLVGTDIPDSRNFTVVKKNGVSTLIRDAAPRAAGAAT